MRCSLVMETANTGQKHPSVPITSKKITTATPFACKRQPSFGFVPNVHFGTCELDIILRMATNGPNAAPVPSHGAPVQRTCSWDQCPSGQCVSALAYGKMLKNVICASVPYLRCHQAISKHRMRCILVTKTSNMGQKCHISLFSRNKNHPLRRCMSDAHIQIFAIICTF